MILKNVAVYYARLRPEFPNKYNPAKPAWTLEIRTFDKAVKRDWQAAKIKVTTVDPDDGPVYYKATLRRKLTGKGDKKLDPVEVINGRGVAIDPGSIGNGSICNIRIFQYDSVNPENGESVRVSMLCAVQVVKHIVYTAPAREGFEEADYEVIGTVGGEPNDKLGGAEDDDDDVAF